MGTPSFHSLCRQAPRGRGSRPWPGAPGHVPPAPTACGPSPCPPCAAAVPPPAPSRPCRPCRVMWRPRPRLRRVPGKLAASVARGHPSAPQGQAPSVRAPRGLAPLLPLAGRGVGAPGRPGPHDVGAMGPSAPPARSAALRPALPARPRLRRRPCRAALPAHSPPGVAAPRGSRWPASGPRQAAPRALAPLRAASSLRGLRRLFGSRRARAAISTAARTGGASAAFPALRARRGAGNAACGRECHSGDTPRKAKASRLRRALRGDRLRGKDANKGARPLWPHTVRPTHHRKE